MDSRFIEKWLDVVFETQATECAAGKHKRSAKALFRNPFFIFLFMSIAKMHPTQPILVSNKSISVQL